MNDELFILFTKNYTILYTYIIELYKIKPNESSFA